MNTGAGTQPSLDRLVEVIALLRRHCPWMAELTHASLVEYLVEECYELVDTIEDAVGPSDGVSVRHAGRGAAREEFRGELGDVLLQVVLHAQLQREQGGFDLTDVIDGLTRKMIRRNAHIFAADGSLRDSFPSDVGSIMATWHRAKRAERPGHTDPFIGIPRHLPALALAAKTLGRAGRFQSTAAQATGFQDGLPETGQPQNEDELGELLLAVVGRSTAAGLDPERALRTAVRRLQENLRETAGRSAGDTDGHGPGVSTTLGMTPPSVPEKP